jgi:DNA mismatch repair protein MutL
LRRLALALNPQPSETAQPSTFRVWGFIGSPGVSRATREGQHLFVNRRPVENRGLNYALLEGYHTALMKGRYPVCCLFLEIDPAAVDVNIHPAKREVKFHREFEIRKLVAQAVQETLLAFHSPGVQSPGSKAQSHRPGGASTGAGNLRAGAAEFSGEIKTVAGNAAANSARRPNAFENGLSLRQNP